MKSPHGPELQRVLDGADVLELSIYEAGVPPRFRLTGAKGAKPTIETLREDGKVQAFAMRDFGGYWESIEAIPEPHQFAITIQVRHDGHVHSYRTQFAEHSHAHGYHKHGQAAAHAHALATGAMAPHADGNHRGHGPGGHTHGVIDPTIATTTRGLWAIKWSFVGLGITALLQLMLVMITGSVALLADTVHNFSDAFTAVPLAVAFAFARRLPTKRFTYGYGRVEDLAGILIVVIIAISAAVAAYESINRLFNPRLIDHVLLVAAAGLIGFVGNEIVAVFRIRVGREIHSAALIADGYHARVDGFTSLAVLAGAVGVWLGFPIADPVAGLLISVLIVKIVWESAVSVFTRALDGVDPKIVDGVAGVAGLAAGVLGVTDVRARWLGHHLSAEVHLTLASTVTVAEAHAAALQVQHDLMHAMPFVSHVTIHADPPNQAGLTQHQLGPHEHDGLPQHAH